MIIQNICQSPLISPLASPRIAGDEWSPLEIPSCRLLLDASDLSTLFTDTGATTSVTASGQRVAAWRDKTANATLFTEGTLANRPIWTSAANPYLDLSDAAGQRLTASVNLSAVGALTWVFGVTRSTAGADQTLVNQNVANNPSFGCLISSSNSLQAASNGGTARSSNQAMSASVPLIEVITSFHRLQSTPLVQTRINGVSGTPTTSGQGAGTAYQNGNVRLFQRTDGIRPLKGRIFAVAAFTTILSGDDLANAEAWVASKAGITI